VTIFRTNHSKNYTVINNTICTDSRISFKAKGIWMYAFSRPDDWVFYLKDIVNQSKDGEDSVRSGLKELEKYGYLVKAQNRKEDGTFGHIDWEFFEVPREVKECLPEPENPHAVNPLPVNPSLLSTDVLPSTEKKQQQQPAAVLPKQVKKELKEPINVNLLYIDIPDAEKRWISERYDDATIKHALSWAQHPETKIKTSLAQAIKWACIQKPEIPSLPEDNRKVAETIKKQVKIPNHLLHTWRIEILNSCVEIICGHRCDILQYSERPFRERLIEMIRKSGCSLS
jgi:hypothetical protein